MLFAGWEVRMVKNCDRGLENTARVQNYCCILLLLKYCPSSKLLFLNLTKFFPKEPE